MNVKKGTEIDVKRLYLDGIVFNKKCCNCGEKIKVDLNEDYLSNPYIGEPEAVYYSCYECGLDGEFKVVVNMTVDEIG